MTQRDQFNSDDFPIAETLLRESHQNSLDGASSPTAQVRTRIVVVEPRAEFATFWRQILEPLRPHLAASKIDLVNVDLSMPRLLVIEDFGTTGLKGAWNQKDELNFSDFWRRFGVSHKRGTSAGRWGLGKLVYSSASLIGTFFGLTIRVDDPRPTRLLMGQAVLNAHRIGAVDYAPHVFLATEGQGGIQIPEIDTPLVDQFIAASGVSRRHEPGLSIVIACVNPSLTPSALLPHVLSSYFFPVLTGSLVVSIGGDTVSEETFDALAEAFGDRNLSDGRIASFIRELQRIRGIPPVMTLNEGWESLVAGQLIQSGVPEASLQIAKETFAAGGIVAVRAPITLHRRSGEGVVTYIDAFLKQSQDHLVGQALYVRGSITIPGEARGFRGRGAFGAVLAEDRGICEFLGDAENPAHTKWVASGDKLNRRWKAAQAKVSAIRRLLNEFFDAVAEPQSRVDENLLVDVFAIPKPVGTSTQKPKRLVVRSAPALPPPTPRRYRIDRIEGGFVVRGNSASTAHVPYAIDVEVAYDTRRGNAFNRYSPLDFDAREPGALTVAAEGVAWTVSGSNRYSIEVSTNAFAFSVVGFDRERDLEVKVS